HRFGFGWLFGNFDGRFQFQHADGGFGDAGGEGGRAGRVDNGAAAVRLCWPRSFLFGSVGRLAVESACPTHFLFGSVGDRFRVGGGRWSFFFGRCRNPPRGR